MFKIQKKILMLSLLVPALLFAMGTGRSYASQIIIFGPHETKIEGSIRYSVIGRYVAHFNGFKGKVILNERSKRVQSVYLEIEAGSIQSNNAWYDKIARSRRLLYTARYPKIIFKSAKITNDESGYKVKGILEMHGIRKIMTFPFKAAIMVDPKTGRKLLDLEGRWDINRKGFNIIWNKHLDHGGVLVSDTFTVNWGIRTYIR